MVEIKVKVQIDAPIEKVREVVSRVDDDPKLWNLTKSMRNLSKNGNEIVREVILGKTEKCHQEIILLPKETVHVLWTKEVITDTKDIVLTLLGNTTLLEVKIDYKISGPARFFPETITDELHMEAELAVDPHKKES